MEKPGREKRTHCAMLKTWSALPYLGYGLWLAWSALAFSGGVWLSDVETSGFPITRLNMTSSVSYGLSCIIAAFTHRHFDRLLNSRAVMLAAGALGALGSLFVIISGPYYLIPIIGKGGADILFYSGAVFTGVASTFLVLKSGQLYSMLSPRRVLMNVALSYILLACIFFIVIGIPKWSPIVGGPSLGGIIAFILALPVAAFVLTLGNTAPTQDNNRPEKSLAKNGEDAVTQHNGQRADKNTVTTRQQELRQTFAFRDLPAAFWKFMLMLLLFSAVVSVMRAYSIHEFPPESTLENSALVMLFRLFFAGFIVVAALSQSLNRINFGKIYSFAALVIVVVIALLPMFGVLNSSLSLIITMAMTVFRFVVFCLLIFICHQERMLSTVIVGLGQGVLLLGDAFGMFMGSTDLLSMIDEQLQPIFYILIAGFVLVLTFILFSERDFDRLFAAISSSDATLQSILETADTADYPEDTNDDNKRVQGRFSVALDGLALEQNLSRRETEVLRYLAMGRGAEYIAESLSISTNTVRTHTQNIFVKLDVHSRSELMDLVDQLKK